jgi:2-polyprenyl-3-methyl-5-hydroxy-6-metoxy-1,4-benzoquinol methylase
MRAEPYTFEYSPDFEEGVRRLHRGKERWPRYRTYLAHHLGGRDSRLSAFVTWLCPEIERRCGSLAPLRVLDFGCGTGATTVALALHAREVVGFDVHEESLELNRQRLAEHGVTERVRLFHAPDFRRIEDRAGTFDLILINDVLEHVPLSRTGLRRELVRTLFRRLEPGGVLYVHQSPNRLWPRDVHTTGLWWIPWTRPGSTWAYGRAVARGAHQENPETHAPGPLGLEQRGAWGITYFELRGYLSDLPHEVLNRRPEQARHVSFLQPPTSRKRRLWDAVLYHGICRWTGVPLTAFSPMILHLAFRRAEPTESPEPADP